MSSTALLIGNSDGIGLAATRRLLAGGWNVIGVSRSVSPIKDSSYVHHVSDVTSAEFGGLLREQVEGHPVDLCVYLAAIGEWLDPLEMASEMRVIDVNLTGMIRAAAGVIPAMVRRGQGHFVGISSFADELLSVEAPSYHASKAGFSSYLGSLALALEHKGIYVTNVRFGFVDTKMAKGDRKPFMMEVEEAVDHLERCIERRPQSYAAPKAAIPLVKFRKWMMRLGR